MVMRGSNLLRGFDEDMRNGMRDAMANDGVVHRFGCLPTSIEKTPSDALRVTLSDSSVIEADQALIATGRNPNTKDLGLEAAGVELSAEHGAVKVNENLTSNVPSIHAIGDATHRVPRLSPFAGHTLADRLFGPGAADPTRSGAWCSARPKRVGRRRPERFRRSTSTRPISDH